MNIFYEVKQHLSARQVAEYYGLKVGRNGTACCPFHDDRHPSMKIDKNYHCFACGVGGDAVDYASRLFSLSQYQAAKKLTEDFALPIEIKGKHELSRAEKERIRKEAEERKRVVHIQKRFEKWCSRTIDMLKESQAEIETVNIYLRGKPPDIVFSDEYAKMLHAEPVIDYWLDILCMGDIAERKELFLKERKEVEKLAGTVRTAGAGIMGRNRGSA